MVDKRTHLDAVHQLGNTANVIAMIVRDQHIIELADAGLMRGSQDPVGVTPLISRPTRIDEQRLSGRTHHQRRLPTFHVDKINLERLFAGGLSSLARQNQHEDTEANNSNQQSTHNLAPDGTLPKIMPRGEADASGLFPDSANRLKITTPSRGNLLMGNSWEMADRQTVLQSSRSGPSRTRQSRSPGRDRDTVPTEPGRPVCTCELSLESLLRVSMDQRGR